MERKNKSDRRLKRKRESIIKVIPLAAVFVMAAILVGIIRKSGEPLSVEAVLRYTPKDPLAAAMVMIVFFALKSLTVVLPISVLYLSSGVLFPPAPAILVSTAGLGVTISLPYWIGRFYGAELVKKICARYPKAEKLAEYQRENCFFACFITRIVGFLPSDIVSLYFGACGVSYPVYLAAGVLGSLLSIVTTTLLGTKLSNPFSVEFIAVLLCRIAVSALSLLVKHKMNPVKK